MELDRRLAALLDDKFVPHCGIELKIDDNGAVYAEFTVSEEHKNAHGYVNGGMLFTLADIAGGAYIADPDRDIMSLDADFHFLKNVKSGRVIARPYPIRVGRKISVIGVNVESETGILMATSTITYYTAEQK